MKREGTAAADQLPAVSSEVKMRSVAVLGASGGVGRQVVYVLRKRGHSVRALIRRPDQADSLEQLGATAVLGDLTGDHVIGDHLIENWESVLLGADAVVWAAGAGSSGRFEEIDGQALIRLADRMAASGPRRLVVVSSLGVDRPEQMSPFLRTVLHVKAVSDAHVQVSGLAYTIVRPGALTNDEGSGLVQVGHTLPGGRIARTDVAAVVVACLEQPLTIGRTFEVTAGTQTVAGALDELTEPAPDGT